MTDALTAELASWVFSDMADPGGLVKMNPTGPEVHAPAVTQKGRARERHLAATGLAATTVAAAGGVHAISATVKENRGRVAAANAGKVGRLSRVTHIKPTRAAELTGAGFLALHGVELTADALAGRAQAKSLKANSKRGKVAARAPGRLIRVEEVEKGVVGNAKMANAYHAWSMGGERQAAKATHSAANAKDASKAARKAKIKAAPGQAADAVKQAAQHPLVRQIMDTTAEGIKRAAVKPPPAKQVGAGWMKPVAAAGGGAVAGAAGVSIYGNRKRRQPIAARAPQDVVDQLEWAGEISKLDTDQHLAFGWASLSKVNGQPYVDRQGDWIPIDETEAAAYDYVINSRVGGDMHRRAGVTKNFGPHKVADLVESFVVTPEKLSKMGLPSDALPEGWWLGMKVHDDTTWADIKAGRRTGFSVHGSGIRKAVTV